MYIFAPTKPDSRKRKLNSHHLSCDSYPLPKQAKHVATKRKMKDVATESKDIPPLKRPCCHSITTTATNPVIPERYRFNPVSQEWQQMICARLQLKFICQNSYDAGGPNVHLTHPNTTQITHIVVDGNCLFRAFAYILTGTQRQHKSIRRLIIHHLPNIAQELIRIGIIENHTLNDYLSVSRMHKQGTWGSTVEIVAFANLIQANSYSYNTEENYYHMFSPRVAEPLRFSEDYTQSSLYLLYTGNNHFNVVCKQNTS